MLGKGSERRSCSEGRKDDFSLFFLKLCKFSEWRERCSVGMRSGRYQFASGEGRKWGIVTHTHTATRTFSIPCGLTNAVKNLTCQTPEVTKGEADCVQWDFRLAGRASSTCSRRLLELNMGLPFYFMEQHLRMCCHPRPLGLVVEINADFFYLFISGRDVF